MTWSDAKTNPNLPGKSDHREFHINKQISVKDFWVSAVVVK